MSLKHPPHPATVVQPRAPSPVIPARPPHPATVAQPRIVVPAVPARPPHPATLARGAARPPSSGCHGPCKHTRCGEHGAPGPAQPMMSLHTKTDDLPMMTRGTYDKVEKSLNKQGLSLDNVVTSSRMRKRAWKFGQTCPNYPDEVSVVVNGVQYDVPYDNANHYACFDPWEVTRVTIAYTGGRNADFAAANGAAGYLATPGNHTWHHVEDYNAVTNQGTMQLVLSDPHNNVYHLGGVWQYTQATGNVYLA